MDKVLALHNVQMVEMAHGENQIKHYAFTSKMYASNIFIEYTTILDEDYLEDGDFDEEEFDEEDFEDENTSDEDAGDDEDTMPEYGTRLTVVMKEQNKFYEFLMFQNGMEIASPVMLVQTILFLVKLIEGLEPHRVVEYLTNISIDQLIPHLIDDKKFKTVANKLLKLKIKSVHELVESNKAGLN